MPNGRRATSDRVSGGLIDGEQGSQQASVDLGVEDGDASSIWGKHVVVGARSPADQTFAAEAAQVIGRGCT